MQTVRFGPLDSRAPGRGARGELRGAPVPLAGALARQCLRRLTPETPADAGDFRITPWPSDQLGQNGSRSFDLGR